MGQKPNRTTKIDSKMCGAPKTPKWNIIGFDPQPLGCSIHVSTWSLLVTLKNWSISQNNEVMDPFLNCHGESRWAVTIVMREPTPLRPTYNHGDNLLSGFNIQVPPKFAALVQGIRQLQIRHMRYGTLWARTPFPRNDPSSTLKNTSKILACASEKTSGNPGKAAGVWKERWLKRTEPESSPRSMGCLYLESPSDP